MKLSRNELRLLILEQLKMVRRNHSGWQGWISEEDEISERSGEKASKSTGKPYKGSRRGKTESQAQQMAAGIALRAREEGSKKAAINKLKGAPKEMAKMSMKDLRKLATIRRGSEVPDSTKKGHERAALPGHIKKGKK